MPFYGILPKNDEVIVEMDGVLPSAIGQDSTKKGQSPVALLLYGENGIGASHLCRPHPSSGSTCSTDINLMFIHTVWRMVVRKAIAAPVLAVGFILRIPSP
jgi:hypothetical protein